MAASKADHPPRFVVQCAKGKGWKTLVVEEDLGRGERAFREVVKVKPKGFFRLIRLDHNPEADYGGREYNWRLLRLHDPRPRDGSGRSGGRGAGWWRWWLRRGERMPLPVWLYGLAIRAGATGAVVLFLLYGPPLTPEPPPPALATPAAGLSAGQAVKGGLGR